MWGLPQKQNARRADKIRLCGHLRRYKKIVKKTYIICLESIVFWKSKTFEMSEDKWSHIRKFLGESGEDILIYHYIQCVICNVINRKNRCYTSCYTRLDAVQKPPFPGASECKYGVRTTDRALTITVFTDIGAVGTVIFLYIRKVLF